MTMVQLPYSCAPTRTVNVVRVVASSRALQSLLKIWDHQTFHNFPSMVKRNSLEYYGGPHFETHKFTDNGQGSGCHNTQRRARTLQPPQVVPGPQSLYLQLQEIPQSLGSRATVSRPQGRSGKCRRKVMSFWRAQPPATPGCWALIHSFKEWKSENAGSQMIQRRHLDASFL